MKEINGANLDAKVIFGIGGQFIYFNYSYVPSMEKY